MISTSPSRTAPVAAATFLVLQFALLWTTFFILSAAIGWPASLDDPASVTLPRLLDAYPAVMTGYGLYLAVALLLVPATAALNVALGITRALAQTTLALAAVSAVAKAIGITRWLFGMPVLAEAWVAPGADHATIALLFDTLNEYASGIGEIVGVGLVTGVWTVIMGTVVARMDGLASRIAGAFVIVMGLSLFLTLPAGFGVDVGPILTVSNVGWQFGMIVLAAMALRRLRPMPSRAAVPA